MAEPAFTILTPSLNDLRYLRRCCASVADQGVPGIEHIVIDGGSVDGSADWLRSNPGLVSVIREDRGMYDALNEGLDHAAGMWVGFLNCDEQYLPGALLGVSDFLKAHPGVDIVTGDFLVVGPEGDLICHRREIVPRSLYIRSAYLYSFTCALFIRRGLLTKDFRFDAGYRASGDEEFILRLLDTARVRHLHRYLAAFTDRPGILSASPNARDETARLRNNDPARIRMLRPLFLAARHLEKAATGGYTTKRLLMYQLFAGEDLTARRAFVVRNAPHRWHRR